MIVDDCLVGLAHGSILVFILRLVFWISVLVLGYEYPNVR